MSHAINPKKIMLFAFKCSEANTKECICLPEIEKHGEFYIHLHKVVQDLNYIF